MTDSLTNPRTQLVWPTVARGDKDEAALAVLGQVLGSAGGAVVVADLVAVAAVVVAETSRAGCFLHSCTIAPSPPAQALRDRSTELAGTFDVNLSARPGGATLDELIKIVDAEIEKLKTEGPTEDELTKIKTARESQLVMSLEAAARKADFLNRYNVEYGDPLAYKKEMADLFAVTPADVKRVANKYLTANRIRVDVVPGDRRSACARSGRRRQEPGTDRDCSDGSDRRYV